MNAPKVNRKTNKHSVKRLRVLLVDQNLRFIHMEVRCETAWSLGNACGIRQ